MTAWRFQLSSSETWGLAMAISSLLLAIILHFYKNKNMLVCTHISKTKHYSALNVVSLEANELQNNPLFTSVSSLMVCMLAW